MKQLRLFAERELIEVLVVDDNDQSFDTIRRRLRRAAPKEYRIRRASTTADALRHIAADAVDVIVLGVRAEDLGGLDRLGGLRAAAIDQPIVIVHHGQNPDAELDAVITGAQDVMSINEATGARLHRALWGAIARKQVETEALATAYSDPVTGLGSRTWMLRRLDRSVSHAEETVGEWQVAVLFLDLDRFKIVNDTLGHAAGDELLRMVAGRLRTVVRNEDPIARFGGDEFVIVIEGHRIDGLAHRIALRALGAFADPFVVEGQPFSVFASIGLALRQPGESPEVVLNHADSALYRAKERGRNRIVAYDDALRAWASSQQDENEAVTAAVRDGALRLESRPLVDLRLRRVVGHYVSPGWDAPVSAAAIESAESVVDIAVRCGVGPDLARWLVTASLEAAAEESLEVERPGRWWLELPTGMLSQFGTAAWIQEECANAGVDPSRLVLVANEVELSDAELVVGVIEDLSELGVSVAMRGFGVGVSSLTLFASAHIDEVHLADGLVKGLATEPTRQALLDGVVRVADSVGQHVVAAGPMSFEDLVAIAEMGCHFAVGDNAAAWISSDDADLRFEWPSVDLRPSAVSP